MNTKIVKQIISFVSVLTLLHGTLPWSEISNVNSLISFPASANETDNPVLAETLDSPVSGDNGENSDLVIEDIVTGSCGENVSFTLDTTTGKLVISGTGDMEYSSTLPPYSEYGDYITSVVVENGVTKIGNNAFQSFKKLAKVQVSDTVTEIDDKAFYGCELLEEAVIPKSVTAIGEGVFWNCYKLHTVNIQGKIKKITENMFYNCKSLTNVNIPVSVTYIDENAFHGTALTEITIPGSVKMIDSRAFYNCDSLQNVVIEEGVEEIGGSAFANCSALTTVRIPSTVTSIGSEAFSGTPFIESYTDEFVILENNALYKYNGSDTNVTVPNGIVSVASGAFSGNTKIESVLFPESVLTINGAFKECTSLKNVSLPQNIETIGDSAFYGCTKLESIVIPDSVTELGSESFYGCISLKNVTMSKNVMFVGEDAFEKTPYLENYPNDLVIFGRALYKYKGAVEEVVIPENVTSISAFAFFEHRELKNVEIPSGVISIGKGAFLVCPAMTKIIIPETVTEIGDYALGYNLNNGSSGLYTKGKLKIIGSIGSVAEEYAIGNGFTFASAEKLMGDCGENLVWSLDAKTGELVISGTGDMFDYDYNNHSPFYDNSELIESVVIKDGVSSVGDYSFYSCKNLSDIEFPESLSTIGKYAFAMSGVFGDIVFSENITHIGASAFYYCNEIKSINIPKNVTYIGSSAFEYCLSLKKIDVSKENTKYMSEDGILYNKNQTKLISVPCSLEIEVLTIPVTVKSVSHAAVRDNKYLRTVVFPEGLTDISYFAFYSCKVLKNLIFCGDAPSLGNNALDTEGITVYCNFSRIGWTSLKDELTSPKDVTWIDLDQYKNQDTLALSADTTRLEVGESVQITAEINPLLCVDFIWASSNTDKAIVSQNGLVTAIAPGSSVITVTSVDGTYSADVTITVSGDEFVMPDYEMISFGNGEIDYKNVGTVTRQIPCEKLHGIYLLDGKTLSFYSFITDTCDVLYEFNGCINAYSEGDLLYVLSGTTCYVYNLLSREVRSVVELDGYNGSAVGADRFGRIYIAATDSKNSSLYKVFLYTADGELLSEMYADTKIYNFNGFDSTNGNFYMESYYDFYSWGFSHPGKGLTMGNVTDNVIMDKDTFSSYLEGGMISRNLGCLMYLCQDYGMSHQDNAALLGDRYLTGVSATYNQVKIIDSKSPSLDTCMTLNRDAIEYELENKYYDTSSIGVRAVYNEVHNSVIVYENNKTLTEYNLDTGEKLSSLTTQHYVFNLLKMGDSLVIIEKEDDAYYIEIINVSDSENLYIIGESKTMKVGESQQLKVESGKYHSQFYIWSSSNDKIATVTDEGKVNAWNAGEVIITCKSMNGNLETQYAITVIETDNVTFQICTNTASDEISNNISENNYSVHGSVVNSYITENSDATLSRIEYIQDKGVIVEKYSMDYNLLESKMINVELPIFGGFYSGENYSFLVFGQRNPSYSDSVEVLRIVKYSKDWKRLSSCSVYGANTYIPFDAGSLRMTETGGNLYVYTCHEMYASDDGLNHQANMTYVVDEEEMTVEQSYYDIMNIGYGYVSHSFNQFIQTDGSAVYRVDHGDAAPRAVSITRCDVDGSVTDVSYTLPLSICGGRGVNSTGVSVGGFELSSNNCLIVGNSVDQSDPDTYSASGQRNIFLTVTDKALGSTNLIWLTNYTEEEKISPRTPQLVKLDDDQFLIMWEEYNSETEAVTVRAITIDGCGTKAMDFTYTNIRLSDCQPIVTSDRLVRWYTTDGINDSMYVISPYYQLMLFGDVNNDGRVTAIDAYLLQRAFVGYDTLDEFKKLIGDINGDGRINTLDCLDILRKAVGFSSDYMTSQEVEISAELIETV